MRFTPHLRNLDWLVSRPIAHRGLHNQTIWENSESAFSAAIRNNYAIECDLQLTADGEAVVFHDNEVDRLLSGKGAVKNFSTSQLKAMSFKSGKDKVQTFAELLEQVNGKVSLIIELKSHWDFDQSLALRTIEVLRNYKGAHALMSFDPEIVECIAEHSPNTVRGITADRVTDSYYAPLSLDRRLAMRNFSHLHETRPHFVSFDFKQLPFQPVSAIRAMGHPIITWTIETKEQAAQALRYCDQITFQGFEPK